MRMVAALLGLAAALATAPATAQSSAASAPGTVVESPTPPVLSPEKQALIREQAKRPNLPVATLNEPVRIDMILPEEVELLDPPRGG